MRRAALVALLATLLLAVLLTGCTTTGSPNDSGDGLHSTVPNVIGMTRDNATAEIEKAGYKVGDVTDSSAGTGQDAVVTKQDPIGNASAPRESSVDIELGVKQ